ncbi:MAG TPA: CDP-glycerol glycerophosphotransferase family protein [Solirubrobacteraceae bacterium]|nr:CDP-glycerol glycerophosphotransferase family protein [Solirubrobacteraceae bacterium]
MWLLEALNALTPKVGDKVVVHSRPDLEDGALAIVQELSARGYAPILLCEQTPNREAASQVQLPAVVMVSKNSLRGRYHFLTAGVVITTHNPYRIHRHPAGQLILNIWHGEPLAKPVGILAGERPVNCTCTTALSRLGQAFRCLEFGLPAHRVLVTGAPRNDRLIRAERGSTRRAASVGEADLLLVWLPTFRSRAQAVGAPAPRADGTPFAGSVPLDADELGRVDRWLGENRGTLLVKPHPLAHAPPLVGYEHIWSIDLPWLWSRHLTLYTLLRGVDCLITDVSSVWIDFLLTDRPMAFFFPDIQRYREARGFNLEPYEDWIPGPLLTQCDGLLDELALLADGQDRFAENRRTLKARLHRYQDAGSARRVLDAVGLSGPPAHSRVRASSQPGN